MSMSASEANKMIEATKRQQQLLYSGISNEQLIMVALLKILERLPVPPQALMYELDDRYHAAQSKEGAR